MYLPWALSRQWSLGSSKAAPNSAAELRHDEQPEKRGRLIRHLEDALELADEIEDGLTGFLIERALDQARARQFTPMR